MHKVCIGKIEELNLMADGMLSPEEIKSMEKHISACSGCASFYADLIAVKTAVSSLELKVPAGLNDRISAAVRKVPEKKFRFKPVYRYATVAAACLALVVTLFATGTFNGLIMSDKTAEVAKMEDMDAERGGAENALKSTGETEELFSDRIEESAASPQDALPPPEPTVDDGYGADEALAEYRFSTSAVERPGTIVVNPEGLPLDSGFSGKQDVFYATGYFSLDEITEILASEFKTRELQSETDSVFFYATADELPALESRFGLVSADKLESEKKEISVRIISVKKDKE